MSALRVLLAVLTALSGMVLVFPIIILGLPFWAVAFATRVITRLLEPHSISWQQVIEFDPVVGWRPKANLDAYCSFEVGVFHAKTDSQGWSGKASITESEVVVFGDSFAFGYGVNAKALFSELNPRFRIKAIGAPGYNMVQELLLMRQLSSQLTNKLVVWFIYLGNDLWENLQPNMQNYRTPFVRKVAGTETWEIVTSHVHPARWWPYHFADTLRAEKRFAGVFSGTTFLSQRIYSACEFLLEEGRDVCRHAGGQLVVMTIPRKLQLSQSEWERRVSRKAHAPTLSPDFPDRKLNEICHKLGVHFVAGKSFLNVHDYIPGEEHWNERGHRRVAKTLWNLHHNYVPGSRECVDGSLSVEPLYAPDDGTLTVETGG